MPERRIYIDKDLVSFVKDLSDPESDYKVFENMAQCLTFAAAYGFKYNKREPINKAPTSMVDPINYQVFQNNNFDTLFNLMAMASEEDYRALGDDDTSVNRRASIFEAYAKGGLKLLKSEVHGNVDYLDSFLGLTLQHALVELDEGDKGGSSFNIADLTI